MMLLRHGAFARKGRLERRRNLIVAITVCLLLLIVAAIYTKVHADSQTAALEGENGLTGGNITGSFSHSAEPATNINRDEKVQLTLTFGIDGNDVVFDAMNVPNWSYDLSSLVSGGSYFSTVDEVDDGIIYYNGNAVGTYEINGNNLVLHPTEEFRNAHMSDNSVALGVTFSLNLNPKTVGSVDQVNSIAIPGSCQTGVTPCTPTTASAITFVEPEVSINEYVLDEQSDEWRADNANNVGIEKDGNNNYIATYNTDFTTNTYFDDLTITLELSNNQSFTGDIAIAYCEGGHCITDSDIKTTTIPSAYINYTTDSTTGNKIATINMQDFLDSCEANGACMDGESKAIEGYKLINSGNNNTYQLIYHGQLNGLTTDTYRADATITGEMYDGSYKTATDYVQYTSVSDPVDGTKSGTKTTINGVTTIDYEIVLTSDDLSGRKIEDFISDDQVLSEDGITITSNGGNAVTIAKTNTCADSSSTNCINSAAIDTTYSSNDVLLFNYVFPSGSNDGPYTITYTVELPTADLGSNVSVNNRVDLVIGDTRYQDIADTTDTHDFRIPQTYVTKEVLSVENQNGVINWLVKIFGPDETTDGVDINGDDINEFVDILVTDYTWREGNIDTYLDYAKVSTNDGALTNLDSTGDTNLNIALTTGRDQSGNQTVSLDKVSYGQVVYLYFKTEATAEYIAQYEGRSVKITNFASVQVDNRIEEAHADATILQPSPDVIEKTVENVNSVYYRLDGSTYQPTNRDGYVWTVKINPGAKGATSPDYEPYFTDTIPAGLFLADGVAEWGTAQWPTYSEGVEKDITQNNFLTYIDVTRLPNGNYSDEYSQIQNVPVTVTVDEFGNGVIEPINLTKLYADTFGDSSCNILDQIQPTFTCAGINNTSYEITYRTTIRETEYRDYANEHVFANTAKLYKSLGDNQFETRDTDIKSVRYVTSTAVKKNDKSDRNLGSDNLIEYNIKVNTESANLNVEEDTLTFTDTIADNMSFYNRNFYTSGDNAEANNNAPIVCIDGSTDGGTEVIVDDCVFSYDSETATITGIIPDDRYLIIKYHALVANPIPGSTQSFANTAKLENDNDVIFESSAQMDHVVKADQAWIVTNGTLTFQKVDSRNTTRTIGGVVFKINSYAYDTANGQVYDFSEESPVPGSPFTTSATNGEATVSGLTGFEGANAGTLYYWTEASAPSPYIPESTASKHYFVLYNVSQLGSETQANRAAAAAMAKLIEDYSSSDEIESGDIMVIPSAYNWIVTNIAQQTSFLDIEKKVNGNKADPTKEFIITITATNSRQEAMNGTVTAYSYNLDNRGSMTQLSDGVTFTNGTATITLKHGQGIRIEGLYVGGDYAVVENNYSDYTTSYTCDDSGVAGGCTAEDGNTGKILAIGQTVAIKNVKQDTITGVKDKKSVNAVFFAIAGSIVAAFGVIVVMKVRR